MILAKDHRITGKLASSETRRKIQMKITGKRGALRARHIIRGCSGGEGRQGGAGGRNKETDTGKSVTIASMRITLCQSRRIHHTPVDTRAVFHL